MKQTGNHYFNMNSYRTSTGESLSNSVIEYRMGLAKKQLLENQVDEHGYNFCEQCGRSSGTYLDCSHDISVKKAKEEGRAELCYKVGNMTVLCRKCHQEKDGLGIKFTKQ